MRHPNEERLRQAVEAVTRSDMKPLRCLLAEDMVFHFPGRNQLSGEYRGREQLVDRFMLRMRELTGGTFQDSVSAVLANEQHGVEWINHVAEVNGKRYEWLDVGLYHFRDGQIVHASICQEDQYLVDEAFSGERTDGFEPGRWWSHEGITHPTVVGRGGAGPNEQRYLDAAWATTRGNEEPFIALLAEDTVLRFPGRNKLSGVYRGRDEGGSLARRQKELTEGTFQYILHDAMANEEHGVELAYLTAERSRKRYEWRDLVMYQFRDGQIAEASVYQSDQYLVDEVFS
jgi:uncharacterized protein